MIRPARRLWLRLGTAAIAGAAWLASPAAWSQQPSRLTIIVPYPPGGLSDLVARLTGNVMAKSLAIPVWSRTGRARTASSAFRRSPPHPPTGRPSASCPRAC